MRGSLLAALAAAQAQLGAAVYLQTPAARQVVTNGGLFPPSQIGSFDAGGRAVEQVQGHGLCGGIKGVPMSSMLESGLWAPTAVQEKYESGGNMELEVVVTDHRFGWFEFRLCVPADGGASDDVETTQECLNQYPLQFDVQITQQQYTDQMRDGLQSPADMTGSGIIDINHGLTRCSQLPGAPDGSCCNNGGVCSTDEANTHRWVLPKPNRDGPGGASLYSLTYRLPENVSCQRCVLQMYYQAGNNPSQYPEGVWNCADIAIAPREAAETLSAGAIVGGTVAAAFVVGALFYVRSSSEDLKQSQAGQSMLKPMPNKKGWMGSMFSKGSEEMQSSRSPGGGGGDDLHIGSPVIIGHSNTPPPLIGGGAGGGGRGGFSPKAFIEPPPEDPPARSTRHSRLPMPSFFSSPFGGRAGASGGASAFGGSASGASAFGGSSTGASAFGSAYAGNRDSQDSLDV